MGRGSLIEGYQGGSLIEGYCPCTNVGGGGVDYRG